MVSPAAGALIACVALAASAIGAACGGGTPAVPASPATAFTSTAPTRGVTIEAIRPTPESSASALVRPDPAGLLEGTLIAGTAEPGRCPEPYVTPIGPPPTPAEDATPAPERIPHEPAADVPRPTATPDLPPLEPDATLEDRIRVRLGDDAPHYAVVVKDLRDGRGVEIDAGRVFYAASLFKLEVMYEIFEQRVAGLLDFGQEYVASDYYSGFDLGPHLVGQCDRVNIGDLLAAMMSVSDNVAAVMLQDRAGAGNINDAMASLGLEQTRLTEDGSLPATAGDLARLLELIARGMAVNRDASKGMADLLATEKIDDRIPQGLPDGTLVAHKTGNWNNATHDAGIIYGERSAYVIVLMSDIGFDGDAAGAAAMEKDITKIAFDYFETP
jgi:beta-lactamase class A